MFDLQNLLKSKLISILLLVAFSAVGFITFQLYLQKHEVDSEIKKLQVKADDLNKNNSELSELVKYFNTNEYSEREAREKLNLKKPGEEVVVLPKNDSDSGQVASAQTNGFNPIKWFNYFFKQ